jgi:hypothetical protein
MNVNFIVTCHNQEYQYDGLMEVLASYRTVVPSVVVCYNGINKTFQSHVRVPNLGLQRGDEELTRLGFRYHRMRDEIPRFIKIGIDSWLCDEGVILKTFEDMESGKCGYGGSYWMGTHQLSTDIFFADTRHGNVFDDLRFDGSCYEEWMRRHCDRLKINRHMIPEREPVHPHNREKCEKLKWTMHYDVHKNIANREKWSINRP